MTGGAKANGWAVVTGASAGIGAEFARQLAARGHDVMLCARREERLHAMALELERRHRVRTLVVAADLATREGRGRLMGALRREGIVPRVFINNAGFGFRGDVADMDPAVIEGMILLNVTAMTLLARAAARRMRRARRGVIVNVGSMAGFQPTPHFAVYGATKAYVQSFSEALERELAPDGVRVNVLCPGPTESEFDSLAGPRYVNPRPPVPVEECVRRALASVDRGLAIHVDGTRNRLMLFAQRLVPRWFVRRMAERTLRVRRP